MKKIAILDGYNNKIHWGGYREPMSLEIVYEEDNNVRGSE